MRDAIALAGLLSEPNVRAFLRVIRAGEGTADEDGYRRQFGGKLFDSMADHPRDPVTARLGSTQITSTAAGAYQFLARTWDGLVKQYGFANFEPRTQDIAALALIDGRKALDDVLAGRVEAAIAKCAREWASLPGSPYGQPTRTLAQALAVYAEFGGARTAQDQSQPVEANLPSPKEETMLPLPALVLTLGQALISAFTPLAAEKINKEIARHTDNPEIANQVTSGLIETAKTLTGQSDPIQAVAAAQASPQIMQQLEDSALANLAKLAPVLDKLAQWDKDAWAAEEQSRDAAAKRAAEDPHDQDSFLTRAIVFMVAALMVTIAVMIGLMVWAKGDSTAIAGLVGLFTTLAGSIAGKFNTRYDHRYGSSRSSGAKDVVIGELSRRK